MVEDAGWHRAPAASGNTPCSRFRGSHALEAHVHDDEHERTRCQGKKGNRFREVQRNSQGACPGGAGLRAGVPETVRRNWRPMSRRRTDAGRPQEL
jgi:hypothetical protein